MTARIPFHRPSIGEDECRAVERVLRSGWLTSGEEGRRFEAELAAATGAPEAVAVASGTAALILGLAAFDIGPGDEVITSPLGFAASVEAILARGAHPVLADVAPRSGNLCPRATERAIGPATRAILAVSLGGDPAELDALRELARARGLLFFVDAAHALETRTAAGPLGADADFCALSFYASKNLTTGEGGAVLLRDGERAARLRRLRVHGMTRAARDREGTARPWEYDVAEAGYKANLSDLAAALGRAQLAHLETRWEARRRLVARYRAALEDCEALLLPSAPDAGRHAWHLFAPLLADERLVARRDAFLERLGAAGIGVSVHFRPLHHHTAFRALAPREGALGAAEDRARRSFSLPLFPDLRSEELDRVVEAVRDALREIGA
ncbi:MAG: DegT/DnrJ/EryC1/StrS aminotransferase family protein [Planctomycetota bacterium]